MTDKKVYELSNPSDAVHVEAEDTTVACVAVLLLGQGRYGLRDEHGETVLPLLFLGGLHQWLAARKITDLDTFLKANASAMADVLDTATLGSAKDFKFFKSAMAAIDDPVKRAAFREEWDDKKRSSTNNICAAAHRLAQRFRERAASPSTTSEGE